MSDICLSFFFFFGFLCPLLFHWWHFPFTTVSMSAACTSTVYSTESRVHLCRGMVGEQLSTTRDLWTQGLYEWKKLHGKTCSCASAAGASSMQLCSYCKWENRCQRILISDISDVFPCNLTINSLQLATKLLSSVILNVKDKRRKMRSLRRDLCGVTSNLKS